MKESLKHRIQTSLSKAVMKGSGFHRVESVDLQRRVDYSYEKYGWTENQKETFKTFKDS